MYTTKYNKKRERKVLHETTFRLVQIDKIEHNFWKERNNFGNSSLFTLQSVILSRYVKTMAFDVSN